MRLKNTGRVSLENTLVLLFIFIITAILLGYYHRYESIIKERLAQEQVYNINTAIVVFVVKKGRFPENLAELTRDYFLEENKEGLVTKKFLDFSPLDSEGYPVDPWGRRYQYDKKNHVAYFQK